MTVIRISSRTTRGLPRLVALRALGLGDLLTAVPVLRALRRTYPHHERVLAAPARFAPLVRLLDGAVHAMIDVDFRARVGVLPASQHAPDVAINLHGRGPDSHRALLALEPSTLVAFAHPDAWPHGLPWPAAAHEREQWCALVPSADPDDLHVARPCHAVEPPLQGVTVVHPGASAPARRWPAQRWAAVARHELRQGRQVVVTGDASEAELAKAVAVEAGIGGRWIVAGRTDVGELAALVATAGRVVCGDTGVAHLATAFASPSVVLFGPVSPARWGPPADTGRHVALWAGRVGDPHADAPDPGLLAITVAQVCAALDVLPDGNDQS